MKYKKFYNNIKQTIISVEFIPLKIRDNYVYKAPFEVDKLFGINVKKREFFKIFGTEYTKELFINTDYPADFGDCHSRNNLLDFGYHITAENVVQSLPRVIITYANNEKDCTKFNTNKQALKRYNKIVKKLKVN